MALPLPALHQLLLFEVGDTPDGLLAGLGSALWEAESGWASVPAVQYAAVKVRACDVLIAYWRDHLSRVLTDDERATIQLRLTSLLATRTTAVSEQATQLQTVSNPGGVAVGALTTTAPIPSPSGWPDANSPRYLHDPNWRGIR